MGEHEVDRQKDHDEGTFEMEMEKDYILCLEMERVQILITFNAN